MWVGHDQSGASERMVSPACACSFAAVRLWSSLSLEGAAEGWIAAAQHQNLIKFQLEQAVAAAACAIGQSHRLIGKRSSKPCTLDMLRNRPCKAGSQSRIVYAIAAAITVTTVHAFSHPGGWGMAGAG